MNHAMILKEELDIPNYDTGIIDPAYHWSEEMTQDEFLKEIMSEEMCPPEITLEEIIERDKDIPVPEDDYFLTLNGIDDSL